jgi:hypothetical protein
VYKWIKDIEPVRQIPTGHFEEVGTNPHLHFLVIIAAPVSPSIICLTEIRNQEGQQRCEPLLLPNARQPESRIEL